MPIQGPQIVITADASKAIQSVNKLTKHIDSALARAVGSADRHLNRLKTSIIAGFSRVGSAISKALSGVSGIISALFGHRMLQQIFNTTNAFAGLQNVFNTFASSSAEAAGQMEFLTRESQRLGFEITTLGAAYQKMFAAGRITGFTAEKIQEIFTSVGEAAAVAGMDTRQFEGALRALHQMMSKGKVQAEELRGQLGEHLPGAFEIAAEAMGLTTKQLDKMLSTGDVTAVQLFENFPRVLREKYGPGLATAMSLPRRELERLKNDIQLAIKSVDSGINAIFSSILSTIRAGLSGITSLFDESFNESLKTASYYIRAIPDILKAAVKFMMQYLQPIIPAFESIWSTVVKITSTVFDWMKSEFGNLFDFIGWTISNLPSIFAEAGRQLGIHFGAAVTAITNLWSDGIDYLKNKFESWLLSLQIGLKAVRLWFSDMMVNIVSVVDSGFQGLASKIIGLADLASVVLPDSWASSIESAGMAIRKSSAGMIEEMRRGNDQLAGQLEALKGTKDKTEQAASASLERLIENQKKNYEHFLDATDRSNEMFKNDMEDTASAAASFSLEIENAVQYYEDLLVASEMEQEVLSETEKSTKKIADNLSKAGEGGDKKVKKIKKEVDKIGDSITNNLNSAWDDFIENGKLSFKDLVQSIEKDILKIMFSENIAQPLGSFLSNMLNSTFGNLTKAGQPGGLGSIGFSQIGANISSGFSSALSSIGTFFTGLFHSGGVPAYGESTGNRLVSMSAFANAPKFHNGIGPGEMPAVLKKDEGVFTKGQMSSMASLSQIKSAMNDPSYVNTNNSVVNFSPQIKVDATGAAPGEERRIRASVRDQMDRSFEMFKQMNNGINRSSSQMGVQLTKSMSNGKRNM